MDAGICEKLELNKILAAVAGGAVLAETKRALLAELPQTEHAAAERLLARTAEAEAALYKFGVGRVEPFPEQGDALDRAAKGAALTCGELLAAAALLRSARTAYRAVTALGEGFPLLADIVRGLRFDQSLEEEIGRCILSEEEVSDAASAELYRIRTSIRALNERIRARLAEALAGEEAKYLREGIVTVRDNRYVLPVRAEYKAKVRGFVHDRSASGATFFIEPEYILEMNNELRELAAEEREEVERILAQLSRRVGALRAELAEDVSRLVQLDAAYAKAEYGYRNGCVRPRLAEGGAISIVKGRHPLLDRRTAVPVSLSLGGKVRFLLVSGPNTGGKTVTLKMCGLFCLMAACGLFVPAAEGTELSVFSQVFCDIGDAQSIEESLSTFSSHIKNVISITERADADSLVLIDELGGGTDPEEGQALAKAVLGYLLRRGCRGIVTTHYTALKEFAYAEEGIENASMEFDMNTLQPLYRLKAGVPGSSNAIAISRRLGLAEEILEDALANLSEGGRRFENVLRAAEKSRIEADEAKTEAERLRAEWQSRLAETETERERLAKEREKLARTARAETRRAVNERAARAEELLGELEKLAKLQEPTQADLIRARTLRNRLEDTAYALEAEEECPAQRVPVDPAALRVGDSVYVPALGSEGKVLSVNARRAEAEVQCGGVRTNVKVSALLSAQNGAGKPSRGGKKAGGEERVQVLRQVAPATEAKTELNVIGCTVLDAVQEVDAFLDRAALAGLEEVRIIHGMGTGRLREGIRRHLRGHAHVASFRGGAYGEGEGGVTVVTLK